ncbi:hypothetical protein CTA2_3937, partial [Colletotrichum tanaceti]
SSGRAFEVDKGGYVLAEGNVFDNVATVIRPGGAGAAGPDDGGDVVEDVALGEDVAALVDLEGAAR